MSYSGIYLLADHTIKITSIYKEIHQLCSGYISDSEPEFEIVTSENDISFERVESQKVHELEGETGIVETSDYLETLAVYRKIAEKLLDYNILLIHGSCLEIDNNAYIFIAKSGTGKSTHTRNWRKFFGKRVTMVNDDKPLVDVSTSLIYGTPWDGKHHLSNNIKVPLKSVIILTRAENNSIREISSAEALDYMMLQTYLPNNSLLKLKALQSLDCLMKKVRFYILGCNQDIDSARVAYEGLTK